MPSRFMSLFAAVLLAATLSSCATPPSDPAERAEFERVNDPLEPTNRVIFEFNRFVDRIFMEPLARAYRWAVPEFGRKIVHNVLYNSEEPVRMANAVLQGRVHDSMKILGRFIVNTGAGLAGIADVASEGGLSKISADFGQTLHVWGFPEGPYTVVPILGPSNPRDSIGFAVDSLAQPWSYGIEEWGTRIQSDYYIYASVAATMLDKRSESLDALEALEKGSLDFYAQIRSVHRQYRNKQLGVSETLPHSEYEDYDSDVPAVVVPKKKKSSYKKPAKAPAPVTQMTPPAAPAPAPALVSSAAPAPQAPAYVPAAAPISQTGTTGQQEQSMQVLAAPETATPGLSQ